MVLSTGVECRIFVSVCAEIVSLVDWSCLAYWPRWCCGKLGARMSNGAEERPDPPVTNQIVGDINAPTVQARDIYGGVHVSNGGSPELHKSPLVVSVEHHPTLQVCTKTGRRSARNPLIPVSGSYVLKVLLEARSAQAVVLRALRVAVLSRCPPLPVQSWLAVHAAMKERPFAVYLNPKVPRVVAKGVGFPFAVTASDPEMFVIRPVSTVDEVRWQLKLDWTYAGRRGTTVIPEDGEGFRLYPHR
jgi:hypothetical protein